MNDANNQADSPIVSLFRKLTLGVYVIGVADGSTRDAFTASTVVQVSYNPLLLSLAINPQHASYSILFAARGWTVSVLSSDQIELARRFGTDSARGQSKMHGVSWGTAGSRAPYLQQSLAYFDCKLVAEYPAGDHRIIVGRVIDGAVLAPAGIPLTYAQTGELDHSSPLYPLSF